MANNRIVPTNKDDAYGAPTAERLLPGEIAFNTFSKKIYSKDANDNIVIMSIGKNASITEDGLMSKEDKVKMDNIPESPLSIDGDETKNFSVANPILPKHAVNLETLTQKIDEKGWVYKTITADYTAVANDFLYIDTLTTGAITVTLPATPSKDDVVGFLDIKNNLSIRPLVINLNGNDIVSLEEDMVVNSDGKSLTLIFDGTSWKIRNSTSSDTPKTVTPTFSIATQVNEFSTTQGTITNYDNTVVYSIRADIGEITNVLNGTFYYTVEQNTTTNNYFTDTIYITATKQSWLESSIVKQNVIVRNAIITADTAVTYLSTEFTLIGAE